jgi:hypothetical protein
LRGAWVGFLIWTAEGSSSSIPGRLYGCDGSAIKREEVDVELRRKLSENRPDAFNLFVRGKQREPENGSRSEEKG